ncbi:MAG: hypothetical protein NTY02_16835 [Acidobacteria bacterium]|nr:hypothetical protein [Acidobacteriota bacterium]
MLSKYGSYGLVLYVHSLLRWVVVAMGVAATARAWSGRLGGKPWTGTDGAFGRAFVVAMDVQFLVGLVLYGVLSPAVAGALSNMAVAMQSRGMRFWLIEHPLSALVAVVLAHIGFLKAKRGGAAAHRDTSIFFTLALLILLAAIPWPIFSYGRALWPTW